MTRSSLAMHGVSCAVMFACALLCNGMIFAAAPVDARRVSGSRVGRPAMSANTNPSARSTSAPARRPNFFQQQQNMTFPADPASATPGGRGALSPEAQSKLPNVDYSQFKSSDLAKRNLPKDKKSGQPMVARVSGRPILLSKFQAELKFVVIEAARMPAPDAPTAAVEAAMTDHVLENLVMVEIFRDYATTHSLRITDREVDELLDNLNRGRRVGRRIEDSALAAGMDQTMLRQQLRDRLLSQKVDTHLAKQVPSVETSELDSTAGEMMDRGGMMTTETVKLRRILVREGAGSVATGKIDPTAEMKALELATRAREAGVDFARLAQESSMDTASRASGGDIGWRRVWRLNPAMAQAVSKAAVGAVVGPIRTSGAYEILKIEARRDNDLPILEHATRVQKSVLTWRDRARKTAPAEKFI